MKDTTQLIEDVDALKALLEDAAQTQRNMDEEKYRSLKTKLTEVPRILPFLPPFLKSRPTLTSFRSHAQQFKSYGERRTYIERSFEPVVTYLYEELQKPVDASEEQKLGSMEDAIKMNASRLLSIMVEKQLQQVTNSELQELSGIENAYDVNDALERLEELGAVEVEWFSSPSSTINFGDVKLKGKGKSMIHNAKNEAIAAREGATLIIHGHDEVSRLKLKNFLTSNLGLSEPIIMGEQAIPGKTLPEKFETLASKVGFAVALMTPDDDGKAKSETDLQARCRQNVIVEIGWFWGKLGREHILLLVKDKVEMPSDLQGLEYFTFTKSIDELSEKIRDFYKAHGVTLK